MTILDPQTLRRELLLDEAINRQMDALVAQATATMLILGSKTSMEENQLRNLLNVAIAQPHVEVIANFIRYQIGRKERDWGVKPDDFGHTLLNDLYGSVKDRATEAIQYVKTKIEDDAAREKRRLDQERLEKQVSDQKLAQIDIQLQQDLATAELLFRQAYAKLIQLYLGYLNRSFYFYKKMQEKSAKERDESYQQEALKLLQRVTKDRKQEVKHAR